MLLYRTRLSFLLLLNSFFLSTHSFGSQYRNYFYEMVKHVSDSGSRSAVLNSILEQSIYGFLDKIQFTGDDQKQSLMMSSADFFREFERRIRKEVSPDLKIVLPNDLVLKILQYFYWSIHFELEDGNTNSVTAVFYEVATRPTSYYRIFGLDTRYSIKVVSNVNNPQWLSANKEKILNIWDELLSYVGRSVGRSNCKSNGLSPGSSVGYNLLQLINPGLLPYVGGLCPPDEFLGIQFADKNSHVDRDYLNFEYHFTDRSLQVFKDGLFGDLLSIISSRPHPALTFVNEIFKKMQSSSDAKAFQPFVSQQLFLKSVFGFLDLTAPDCSSEFKIPLTQVYQNLDLQVVKEKLPLQLQIAELLDSLGSNNYEKILLVQIEKLAPNNKGGTYLPRFLKQQDNPLVQNQLNPSPISYDEFIQKYTAEGVIYSHMSSTQLRFSSNFMRLFTSSSELPAFKLTKDPVSDHLAGFGVYIPFKLIKTQGGYPKISTHSTQDPLKIETIVQYQKLGFDVIVQGSNVFVLHTRGLEAQLPSSPADILKLYDLNLSLQVDRFLSQKSSLGKEEAFQRSVSLLKQLDLYSQYCKFYLNESKAMKGITPPTALIHKLVHALINDPYSCHFLRDPDVLSLHSVDIFKALVPLCRLSLIEHVNYLDFNKMFPVSVKIKQLVPGDINPDIALEAVEFLIKETISMLPKNQQNQQYTIDLSIPYHLVGASITGALNANKIFFNLLELVSKLCPRGDCFLSNPLDEVYLGEKNLLFQSTVAKRIDLLEFMLSRSNKKIVASLLKKNISPNHFYSLLHLVTLYCNQSDSKENLDLLDFFIKTYPKYSVDVGSLSSILGTPFQMAQACTDPVRKRKMLSIFSNQPVEEQGFIQQEQQIMPQVREKEMFDKQIQTDQLFFIKPGSKTLDKKEKD